jgi:4-amino-4-deoxy-L-arabinose transferase-like glycosyltransferase
MIPGPAIDRRRFWPWLTVWTLVGLGIRLASVYGRPNKAPGGDPGYAWGVAKLLVAGKGFINPLAYGYHNQHHILQTAQWPPLWTFVLTVPMLFGFHSFFAARIWSCFVGAAAIVVCGLAGREVAGRRVGLITGLIIALDPNMWTNAELALSETLSPLLVALVLWMAYRFWRRPGMGNIAALGAAIGLAALGRDELSLLLVLILLPLVLMIRSVDWRGRIGLLLVGGVMAGVVVFPWVGYNLSRFDRVVTISDGLGPTLLSANCGVTYSGPFEGYWSWECVKTVQPNHSVDESVNNDADQSAAMKYIRAHEGDLPRVTLARFGRGLGLFHPMEQVRFDSLVETRPYQWWLTALYLYYALFVLSVGGSLILRRRKIPIFPLWAIALDVLAVFVLSFGQPRYRVTLEVSLTILASVQIEWLWARLVPRRRAGEAESDGESTAAIPTPSPATV